MSFAAGLRRRFWTWVAQQINHELIAAWSGLSDRIHRHQDKLEELEQKIRDLELRATMLEATGRRD